MSVIYCHRGGHYVDTDFEESAIVGKDDEEVCCDCLTDDEYELLNGEDVDPKEINFDQSNQEAGK